MPASHTYMRNTAMFSLLPASIGAVGCYSLAKDESVSAFVQNFRLPSWTFKNPLVHAAIDVAVLSPLGYASYKLYYDGGGFDYTDTTVALGLYGLNMAGLAALIPAFKKKNLKCIATVCLLNTLTAAGAAIASFGISKKASWFFLPYVLWSSYYAALTTKIYLNDQKADKSETEME